MKKTVQERRAELEARLSELDTRMHEIEDALDDPAPKDWNEAAQDAEGDEVLERLGVTSEAEVAQIRAALVRMDEGEYGYCVSCGKDISEERLNLLPATPFCRNCAPR